MYTIKLRNLPNDITEDDIFNVVTKFGPVVKVKIPIEELPGGRRKRNRGFAFVTFETMESATRALEQGDVTVEFATLEVERAMKRAPMQRDGRNPHEFDAPLTRQKQ